MATNDEFLLPNFASLVAKCGDFNAYFFGVSVGLGAAAGRRSGSRNHQAKLRACCMLHTLQVTTCPPSNHSSQRDWDVREGEHHGTSAKLRLPREVDLRGWGFTLRQFVVRFAKILCRHGEDEGETVGDFSPAMKKWSTKNADADGKPLEHAFDISVLDPIFRIFPAVMNRRKEDVFPTIEKLDVKLLQEKDLEGKVLLKVVMHEFTPAGDSLHK